MANVQHKDLPNADLHETKGISSATAESILVADGAGSGTWKRRLYKYEVSITPSSVSANTSAEQTFTVTGLVASTDFIIGVEAPSGPTAGTGMTGFRVSADNTAAITFMNTTAGGLTPPAGVYAFIIWRN